jgi:hypothetical protein
LFPFLDVLPDFQGVDFLTFEIAHDEFVTNKTEPTSVAFPAKLFQPTRAASMEVVLIRGELRKRTTAYRAAAALLSDLSLLIR